MIHELDSTITLVGSDELGPALKRLERVKAIQHQLFEQWAVLETLTPIEYAQFRDQLGHSSGFQSVQYRIVERIIGHKPGTGGFSGVRFLRAALDLTFFPELLRVYTEIESP